SCGAFYLQALALNGRFWLHHAAGLSVADGLTFGGEHRRRLAAVPRTCAQWLLLRAGPDQCLAQRGSSENLGEKGRPGLQWARAGGGQAHSLSSARRSRNG